MDNEKLAAEYRESAALCEERIAELKKQLRKRGLRELDKRRIKSRINKLAQMRDEAIETAVELEHYYDKTFKQNKHYTP